MKRRLYLVPQVRYNCADPLQEAVFHVCVRSVQQKRSNDEITTVEIYNNQYIKRATMNIDKIGSKINFKSHLSVDQTCRR